MKILKSVLLYSFVLSLLASCGQIKIKDQIHCGDAGSMGASCFHTQAQNQDFDLTPSEWEEYRFGMVCTDAKNYAENVATIEKACRSCRCCSYDQKRQILKVKKKIKSFRKTTHK